MELKNYMEDYVISKLNEVMLQYPDCCQCESCKMDIANLALNHLPPKYVSTEKGRVFARVECMESALAVEALKQIDAAIAIVQAHPRHHLV